MRRATRVLDVAVVLAVLGWTAVLALPTPPALHPLGVPVPGFALVVPAVVVPAVVAVAVVAVAVVAVAVAIHRMGRIDRRTLRHGPTWPPSPACR